METRATVLVMNDVDHHIEPLSQDLHEQGYTVLMAEDGDHGWELIHDPDEAIQAILLNKMMLTQDGMEFIARVHNEPHFTQLPIILQTNQNERESVAEGINAGVYYYLPTSYAKEEMVSLVQSAITDYQDSTAICKDLQQFNRKLHLVRGSHFEVQTIEEAKYLATFLAQFFPDPERVVFGIVELIVNGCLLYTSDAADES